MANEPTLRESIGIYSSGETATMVHVVSTQDRGIEIIDRQEGELEQIAGYVHPFYRRVYQRIGRPKSTYNDGPAELAVVHVMSGESLLARTIKLPPVPSERMSEIVEFEAKQNIPFPMDEVSWGYRLNMGREEYSALLVATKKDTVEKQVMRLMGAGIKPTSIVTSFESIARMVDKGVIIYPEGKSYTLVIVPGDGSFIPRTMPVSEPTRVWGEINRSFNVYRAQADNPKDALDTLSTLFQRELDPVLTQLLKEKAVVKEVRQITYDIFNGTSCPEYIALGAAIAGIKGDGIDLLKPRQKQAPADLDSAMKAELAFLQELHGMIIDRVNVLDTSNEVLTRLNGTAKP